MRLKHRNKAQLEASITPPPTLTISHKCNTARRLDFLLTCTYLASIIQSGIRLICAVKLRCAVLIEEVEGE